MGSREKLSYALGATRQNHPNGRPWNFQPRHRPSSWDFSPHGSTLAGAFFVPALRWTGKRRTPARPHSENLATENPSCRQSDLGHNATQCYPLEHTDHGRSPGSEPSHDSSDMETTQPEAPFGQDLQAQPRQTFLEKLIDVVGLYLNPPDKSLVLCVDEKSQIQALDRTQPGLPLKKGRCGTMTHDYKRNGTTTLFAALSMLDGKVIGDCMPRHRHQEFIRFLKKIDAETAPELDLHLIVDNYGTHKHPRVKSWLRRHPRFHLHFIPTSSSWLNLVERWFREITDKRIRRGSFASVPDLIAAIKEYLDNHNQNPQVFTWTASVERIMTKVAKCKEALDALH